MHERVKKVVDSQLKDSEEALVNSLFEDFYKKRYHVYKLNFFRGIFFGLGSVLGGSVVIAAIAWVVTLFIDVSGLENFLNSIREFLNIQS